MNYISLRDRVSINFYCFSLPYKVIVNDPVSLIVLPGMDAHFYCSGIGEIVIWEVDGLPLNNAEIKG